MKISKEILGQIQKDVENCDNQKSRQGSEALYNALIARYTLLDSDFKKGLPDNGKATVPGQEFDYRPELKAISEKLKMILLINRNEITESENSQLLKIKEFIVRGEKIKKEEYHPAQSGFPFSYVSGPQYDQWMAEINIVNERILKEHPLNESIHIAYQQKDNNPSAFDKMMGYLKAVADDNEFWNSIEQNEDYFVEKEGTEMSNKKVFIVHGHDKLAETEVARFIEKFDLEAIILHEQPNSGKTIIEKIEANSDVQYAVVLYTPCDMGRAKEASVDEERARARQNVVFEHGYLIGKLGRDKVSALVKGDIEKPGDISGVVYISMDDIGAWKTELAREMKSAGLEVDMNKL